MRPPRDRRLHAETDQLPVVGSLCTGYRGLDLGVLAAFGMGLREGWVTNLPLPRTAQLRVLGNGVVPLQAAHAVSLLLADLDAVLHSADQSDPDREVSGGKTVTAPRGPHLTLIAADAPRDEKDGPDCCSTWPCRSGKPVPDASGTCAA